MNQRDAFYVELAEEINRTVGRNAVSPQKIKSLIKQAKQIRRSYGKMGLWAFARELPWQIFTPREIDRLQRSPRWHELSNRFVDAMVMEGVITPFEANMIRRYL
jgi:hypothetical protein